MKELPSQERLNELFDYSIITGDLFNKVKRKGVKVGARMGYKEPCGRIQVTIDGERFRLHRVVWKLITGEDPENMIDHKDRDPSNNSWLNLRISNDSLNQGNTTGGHGRFPYKGVSVGKSGRYFARIGAGKNFKRSKESFETVEEAAIAYNKLAIERYGDHAYLNIIQK